MNSVPYRVEVDWAPAHELVASLQAFVMRRSHKVMDLAPGWAERVRKQLGPELAAELTGKQDTPLLPPDILIRECPGERDVDGFLGWLESLSPGDIYERLAPRTPEDAKFPKDLGAARDGLVRTLRAWDERYFRTIDPAILSGLAAEAAARRAELPPASPEDYVERVTRGVFIEGAPDLEVVVLTPQYHARPFALYADYRGLTTLSYAAEVIPLKPGQPPPTLLRTARALADESRLRILRFLSDGVRSFTEVVRFSRLAKSTVYHHLVILRAAGLVRIRHGRGGAVDRYSRRPGALAALKDGIEEFLES